MGLAKTGFGLFSSSALRPSDRAARPLAPKRLRRFVEHGFSPPNLPPLKKAPIEGAFLMAERMGFEPTVQLYTVQRFSKPPPSATRPYLHRPPICPTRCRPASVTCAHLRFRSSYPVKVCSGVASPRFPTICLRSRHRRPRYESNGWPRPILAGGQVRQPERSVHP